MNDLKIDPSVLYEDNNKQTGEGLTSKYGLNLFEKQNENKNSNALNNSLFTNKQPTSQNQVDNLFKSEQKQYFEEQQQVNVGIILIYILLIFVGIEFVRLMYILIKKRKEKNVSEFSNKQKSI